MSNQNRVPLIEILANNTKIEYSHKDETNGIITEAKYTCPNGFKSSVVAMGVYETDTKRTDILKEQCKIDNIEYCKESIYQRIYEFETYLSAELGTLSFLRNPANQYANDSSNDSNEPSERPTLKLL